MQGGQCLNRPPIELKDDAVTVVTDPAADGKTVSN